MHKCLTYNIKNLLWFVPFKLIVFDIFRIIYYIIFQKKFSNENYNFSNDNFEKKLIFLIKLFLDISVDLVSHSL